jgi:protein gp37
MSDLFHEDIPFNFVEKVFEVMRKNKQHIFQVVTKRAENMNKILQKVNIPDNVWI